MVKMGTSALAEAFGWFQSDCEFVEKLTKMRRIKVSRF